MWSVTPTTNWIIVFGGDGLYTDTRVIELSKYMYAVVDTMCIGGSRNFKRGVPNQLNGCGHKYYIKLWVWFVMFIGKMDAKPTEL